MEVHTAYARYEQVLRLVEQASGKVTDSAFTDEVMLSLVFHTGDETGFVAAFTELMNGRPQLSVGAPRFAEF